MKAILYILSLQFNCLFLYNTCNLASVAKLLAIFEIFWLAFKNSGMFINSKIFCINFAVVEMYTLILPWII